MYDVTSLRTVPLEATGTYWKSSAILHKEAGKGVLAENHIGVGEVIGYYFGSLVYSDVYE